MSSRLDASKLSEEAVPPRRASLLLIRWLVQRRCRLDHLDKSGYCSCREQRWVALGALGETEVRREPVCRFDEMPRSG